MANLNAVVTFLTAVGFLENLYAVVMFYAFWAWYMGHTSEYADFTFFDSFCFNRIHCNFHYWAWLSLVYGSYEQVANLYTVITFVDRLIWLRHTSSQKIYVCFGRFLTALVTTENDYVSKEFIVICISQPIYFMLHCRLWIFYIFAQW